MDMNGMELQLGGWFQKRGLKILILIMNASIRKMKPIHFPPIQRYGNFWKAFLVLFQY